MEDSRRPEPARGARFPRSKNIEEPSGIPVRVIEYEVTNREGKGEIFCLITTVMDPEDATVRRRFPPCRLVNAPAATFAEILEDSTPAGIAAARESQPDTCPCLPGETQRRHHDAVSHARTSIFSPSLN